MKKLAAMMMLILLAVNLSGCAGMTYGQRQAVGIVGGGVAGGLAGSAITGGSTAGTIVGSVGGAYVGSRLAN